MTSGRALVAAALLPALSCCGARVTAAEESLPLLHAVSKTVDVRDGGRFLEGVWIADPANPLDVYAARKTARPKTITFLSDVDSLSFPVEAGRNYDFVILLGDADSCRTRIATAMRGCRRAEAPAPTVVPIAIRHGKLHVEGRINGSGPLDLIFDTGADIHVLYPSGRRKGVEVTFDGSARNTGTGGTVDRRVSRDNHLEVGGLSWDHEPFLYVEKQADAADGIVGYPAFEDEVIEIDYGSMTMTVQETLPAHAADFVRAGMHFQGSLTSVEAGMGLGSARTTGLFVLDTGGAGTLMANRAFAAKHDLYGALPRRGASTSRGVGNGAVHNEVVLLPELTLAGVDLRDVPMHVELPAEGAADPPQGTLCMDVLSRFDTILDYSRYDAYFRPNAGVDAPFRKSIGAWVLAAAAGGALSGVLFGLWTRRRRAHSPSRSR